MSSPSLRRLWVLVVLVPVLFGVGWVMVSGDRLGDERGADGGGGRPPVAVDGGGGGHSPSADAVARARRALDDAAGRSGLVDGGVARAADGAGELADGTGRARAGATELSEGMRQLQAGTGALGTGSQQVSDGVGRLVDGITGLAAFQGQAETLATDTLRDLQGDDPQVRRARELLQQLLDTLRSRGIDQQMLDDLQRLRGGAAEVARQLNSPGGEFRGGVFRATAGARNLADGMRQIDDGAGQLRDGLGRLRPLVLANGVDVRQARNELYGGVAPEAALPREGAADDVAVAAGLGAGAAAAWVPAALVTAAAVAFAVGRGRRAEVDGGAGAGLRGTLGAMVPVWAAAGLLVSMFAPGVGTGRLLGALGVLGVAAVAFVVVAAAVRAAWPRVGAAVLGVLVPAQLAVSGWAWTRPEAAAGVAGRLDAAMPLGWVAGAVRAVLGQAPEQAPPLGVALVVVVGFGVAGAVALRGGARSAG